MQCNDFATIVCEIATKFLYPVAKLQLDLFVNFEPWETQSLPYIIYSLKFYSSVLTSLLSVKWSLLMWNLLCIFGDSLPLNKNTQKIEIRNSWVQFCKKEQHVRNKTFSHWVPIPFWSCDSNFPFLSICLIDFVLLQRNHKEVIQATIFIKGVETLGEGMHSRHILPLPLPTLSLCTTVQCSFSFHLMKSPLKNFSILFVFYTYFIAIIPILILF